MPMNAGPGRPKGSLNKATAEVRALAQVYTALQNAFPRTTSTRRCTPMNSRISTSGACSGPTWLESGVTDVLWPARAEGGHLRRRALSGGLSGRQAKTEDVEMRTVR